VVGERFSSWTAADRSLKYSLGEISSSSAALVFFLPLAAPSAGAAAAFSAFSLAFCSAFRRRFSSLWGEKVE